MSGRHNAFADQRWKEDEANETHGKCPTLEEDISVDECLQAQPGKAGVPSSGQTAKCQAFSATAPNAMQLESSQDRGVSQNRCVCAVDDHNELCEVTYCDAELANSSPSLSVQDDSGGNEKQQRDNDNASVKSQFNLEVNGVDNGLLCSALSVHPQWPCVRDEVCQDSSSEEYNAACHFLGEIIDGAIRKIELAALRGQQAGELSDTDCTKSRSLSSITSNQSEAQICIPGGPKRETTERKAQLNVSFASLLESCRVYTPSPCLSSASTVDITPEIGTHQGERAATRSEVTSICDVESKFAASESASDSHDQSQNASEDNHSNEAVPCLPTTSTKTKSTKVLGDQESLDGENVLSNEINHTTTAVGAILDEKFKRNIAVDELPGSLYVKQDSEAAEYEAVEIDNKSSSKRTGSYEIMQIIPGERQIHYVTEQMLPKIEQDMISSSNDLFDSVDSQQNTHTADTQTAASQDLFSLSPKLSAKLSCQGNEIENQKQSHNGDLAIALESTRDLPGPHMDSRDSPVVDNTETKKGGDHQTSQSNRFVSSGDLFSPMVVFRPVQTANSVHEGQESSVEACHAEQRLCPVTDPFISEPYQHIVQLIFDHPLVHRSSPQSNQNGESTMHPELPVEVEPLHPSDSNRHTESLDEVREKFEEETDACQSDNNVEDTEKEILVEPEEMSQNDHVQMSSSKGNVSTEPCANTTTQLNQNQQMTNERELFAEQTPSTDEAGKIDEQFAQENYLIDGQIGSGGKDGTQCTSPEWPRVPDPMNLLYHDEQKQVDNSAASTENKVTNEMHVDAVQIPANELQLPAEGSSVVQGNFREEIHPDTFPQTSVMSSVRDPSPPVAVTEQSTKQSPTQSIIEERDQSVAQHVACSETTSFVAGSLAGADQCVGSSVCEKSEVQEAKEEGQENIPTASGGPRIPEEEKEEGQENIPAACGGPIDPEEANDEPQPPADLNEINDLDMYYPDSGISNSSPSTEVEVQLQCQGGGQVLELNVCNAEVIEEEDTMQIEVDHEKCQETEVEEAQCTEQKRETEFSTCGVVQPQLQEDSVVLPLDCSVSAENGNSNPETAAAEIDQLVKILVKAVCGEQMTREIEELLDPACYLTHEATATLFPPCQVPGEEEREDGSPAAKIRKLEDSSQERSEQTLKNMIVYDNLISQDGVQTKPEETKAVKFSEGNLEPYSQELVIDLQAEHLPLKKRSISFLDERENSFSNASAENRSGDDSWKSSEADFESAASKDGNEDMSSGEVSERLPDHDKSTFVRSEMEKLFPAPSQPQYKLYDDDDDSEGEYSSEDDQQGDSQPKWLSSILASQPQYGLLDQDYQCVPSSRQWLEKKLHGEVRDSSLSGSSSSDKYSTSAFGDEAAADDQQVPCNPSVQKPLTDDSGENTVQFTRPGRPTKLNRARRFISQCDHPVISLCHSGQVVPLDQRHGDSGLFGEGSQSAFTTRFSETENWVSATNNPFLLCFPAKLMSFRL